MVKLRTRTRGLRGTGRNYHTNLGLKNSSCVSQVTVPDPAGTTPDPAGKNINMRSFKPNQASCTPDFSYPLISSILFPS